MGVAVTRFIGHILGRERGRALGAAQESGKERPEPRANKTRMKKSNIFDCLGSDSKKIWGKFSGMVWGKVVHTYVLFNFSYGASFFHWGKLLGYLSGKKLFQLHWASSLDLESLRELAIVFRHLLPGTGFTNLNSKVTCQGSLRNSDLERSQKQMF